MIAKSRSGYTRYQELVLRGLSDDTAWAAVKRVVEQRDGTRCRVCKRRCWFGSRVRSEKADPHHLVLRSLGGADSTANVLKTCRWCHDEIHAHHRLALSGNADEPAGVKVEKLTESGWEVVAWV